MNSAVDNGNALGPGKVCSYTLMIVWTNGSNELTKFFFDLKYPKKLLRGESKTRQIKGR